MSDVLEQLRALANGTFGRTVSDDEFIAAVCEAAIDALAARDAEIARLRAVLGRIQEAATDTPSVVHMDEALDSIVRMCEDALSGDTP